MASSIIKNNMEHNRSTMKRKRSTTAAKKIIGTVVLMKTDVLELKVFPAIAFDPFNEPLGSKISLQLVSSVNAYPADENRGKIGKASYLEESLIRHAGLAAGESAYKVTFDSGEDIGVPGAVIVRNEHSYRFYLRTITLEDVPDHGKVLIVCNSWVYQASFYKGRIFFSNKAYLPHETPAPLIKYREEELEALRGTGEGKLEEWKRIYDYAYYNDLGDPDKGPEYVRPILGGSSDYPYPRRGRTGRPSTQTDPKSESKVQRVQEPDIYVPRDERVGHLKTLDFLGYLLQCLSEDMIPKPEPLPNKTPDEFHSLQDIQKLYEGGIKLPETSFLSKIIESMPSKEAKQQLLIDRKPRLKFPMPQVIKEDKTAWKTDEEFAREMLAGVNPVIIRLLEEFPPQSKLDQTVYGNQNSSITKEHVEDKMNGLTVHEAIEQKKLFILDHHDTVMPYLRRINTTSTKAYASRTPLFLNDDGTLKPLAVELSLPDPAGDQSGPVSKVYTPAEEGVAGTIWQLAKAYVTVNDSGSHQLISHWLHTHAVMEPFVIATNRQLSVLHPIYKLLQPHFRDTMNINATAREVLINAGGIFERTVFPGKYALEMSSSLYNNWAFTEQALPRDLIKRGMAVKDSSYPHGYRLLIEDYPFAVDGLEIWSAIETWVKEYCSFYYRTDKMIAEDVELQSWWKDIREKGHGDKKDENSGWPEMKTFDELTETCTIIIWVASALHAAINFGQFPYAGYPPNRPTISRCFMPEPGTPEFEELESKPETAFLKTITSKFETLLGVSLIEILSKHSSDEVYLGKRDTREWTQDAAPLQAFENFGKRLREIEKSITDRNTSGRWRNRVGPVKMPYTLLYPTSESGITGRGIPNSISI